MLNILVHYWRLLSVWQQPSLRIRLEIISKVCTKLCVLSTKYFFFVWAMTGCSPEQAQPLTQPNSSDARTFFQKKKEKEASLSSCLAKFQPFVMGNCVWGHKDNDQPASHGYQSHYYNNPHHMCYIKSWKSVEPDQPRESNTAILSTGHP